MGSGPLGTLLALSWNQTAAADARPTLPPSHSTTNRACALLLLSPAGVWATTTLAGCCGGAHGGAADGPAEMRSGGAAAGARKGGGLAAGAEAEAEGRRGGGGGAEGRAGGRAGGGR
ncbi:hypothetical protein ZWY2020_013283 [Hordeum vulgare]|nr:hypothetical protein ZWY2020_013283 [Hordeum vulgare]